MSYGLRYTVSATYHSIGDVRWKTWDVLDSTYYDRDLEPVAQCPTRVAAELVALALNQWDVLSQGVTA